MQKLISAWSVVLVLYMYQYFHVSVIQDKCFFPCHLDTATQYQQVKVVLILTLWKKATYPDPVK